MIHEEVILAGENKKTPQYFPVYIHLYHDGYDSHQVPYQEKLLRNIRLLRKMSEQNPSDPKWLYYLGRELCSYGEVQQAREVLENAEKHALLTRHGRTLSIQSLLYSIYSQQQDTYEQAEAVCNRMLEVEPSFPDAYYYLARIQSLRAIQLLQAARKNVIQAEESFERYRGWTEANKDIYHWKNHLLYADIMKMCGNLADAQTIYTELLSVCPDQEKNDIHKSLAFIQSQKQQLQK
ncbi:tetratricopeptide repeat protein [Aneurinibacillus danicus]|uniref:Tetratricopeptide repeat protein n=1 Tax=Aneurinibacillus danicus TaxID=267746 RepID=A0A511V7X4_9BACL|nr:hypothetical protein [Aneurinibacillus danicus]GEN35034.1 hypothetical protein ADA01nite_24940 [Aneurinibacillus danicus]